MAVPGISRIAALAGIIAMTGGALAADPSIRKKGEPATFTGSSFGDLVTKLGDDDKVVGTFDKGGKLVARGNMDNPNYVGFWTAERVRPGNATTSATAPAIGARSPSR